MIKKYFGFVGIIVFLISICCYIYYENYILKSKYLQLVRQEINYFTWNGNLEKVKELLEDEKKFTNSNPKLMEEYIQGACKMDHLDIVKYLIKAGSNANDEAAIFCAIRNGNFEILKLLSDNGAKLSGKDLGTAAHYGWIEIVNFLIKTGVNVNYVDEEGNTPLLFAVGYGSCPSFEVIKMLVENGADVNAKNRDGKSLIELLTIILNENQSVNKKNFINIINYLKEKGAK